MTRSRLCALLSLQTLRSVRLIAVETVNDEEDEVQDSDEEVRVDRGSFDLYRHVVHNHGTAKDNYYQIVCKLGIVGTVLSNTLYCNKYARTLYCKRNHESCNVGRGYRKNISIDI